MAGEVFPKLGPHVAHFLARTLFKTSLYALNTATWRYGPTTLQLLAFAVLRSNLVASSISETWHPASCAPMQPVRCSFGLGMCMLRLQKIAVDM